MSQAVSWHSIRRPAPRWGRVTRSRRTLPPTHRRCPSDRAGRWYRLMMEPCFSCLWTSCVDTAVIGGYTSPPGTDRGGTMKRLICLVLLLPLAGCELFEDFTALAEPGPASPFT